MFDTAIIGTGPAGLSAALNLKLRGKNLIWFGSLDFSPKVGKSEKIANYPGFPEISGEELNRRFAEHAASMGLTPVDRMVTTVMSTGSSFALLAENEMYEARSLLLATGSVSAAGIPGEDQLLGRGVSYCATCDGFLYKGKTIAVICAAPRFEPEVRYLAEMARMVYVYAPYSDFAVSGDNILRLEKPIRSVGGQERVTEITSGGEEIPVDGLFCLRNALAPQTLVPGLQTQGSRIPVNVAMETNLPGCYAAGDCVGRPYQIAKAVGEGNVAAHSILEYLDKLEK